MENSKFTKNDQGFICNNCGKKVAPLKYTSRDHCPYCLYSMHVDIYPGDRANECCGVLKPIGLEINNKGYVIIYKCEKCGSIKKNKSAIDDNYEKIVELSTKRW